MTSTDVRQPEAIREILARLRHCEEQLGELAKRMGATDETETSAQKRDEVTEEASEASAY